MSEDIYKTHYRHWQRFMRFYNVYIYIVAGVTILIGGAVLIAGRYADPFAIMEPLEQFFFLLGTEWLLLATLVYWLRARRYAIWLYKSGVPGTEIYRQQYLDYRRRKFRQRLIVTALTNKEKTLEMRIRCAVFSATMPLEYDENEERIVVNGIIIDKK